MSDQTTTTPPTWRDLADRPAGQILDGGAPATAPAAGDVLTVLRKLLAEVQAEHDAADPAVRFIYRSELSGVRRALGRVEAAIVDRVGL